MTSDLIEQFRSFSELDITFACIRCRLSDMGGGSPIGEP